MAANPSLLTGSSSAASFGRRGRNHSSSSSMDRVRNSVESLLSRASRDNLRSAGSRGNAPGANATFGVVDVPTGGGNSTLFVRSGGPVPVGGSGGSGTTAAAAAAGYSTYNDGTISAAATGSSVSAAAALSKSEPAAGTMRSSPTVVTANIRYRNDIGRAAVLSVARSVNHDFGALTSIVNVTLGSIADLDALTANPDIEWVDKNGAVFFVQPFGKS